MSGGAPINTDVAVMDMIELITNVIEILKNLNNQIKREEANEIVLKLIEMTVKLDQKVHNNLQTSVFQKMMNNVNDFLANNNLTLLQKIMPNKEGTVPLLSGGSSEHLKNIRNTVMDVLGDYDVIDEKKKLIEENNKVNIFIDTIIDLLTFVDANKDTLTFDKEKILQVEQEQKRLTGLADARLGGFRSEMKGVNQTLSAQKGGADPENTDNFFFHQNKSLMRPLQKLKLFIKTLKI